MIDLRSVLAAFACGVLATCLAAMSLLSDLRPERALDAVYLEDGAPGTH